MWEVQNALSKRTLIVFIDDKKRIIMQLRERERERELVFQEKIREKKPLKNKPYF